MPVVTIQTGSHESRAGERLSALRKALQTFRLALATCRGHRPDNEFIKGAFFDIVALLSELISLVEAVRDAESCAAELQNANRLSAYPSWDQFGVPEAILIALHKLSPAIQMCGPCR